MFAPVIHTYGAISSVRNALCIYLWLQNPPDRGRLIFMGSVNRDFVFRGLQADTQFTHVRAHRQRMGEKSIYGRLHTVQPVHRRVHMHVQSLHAHEHLLKCPDKLNAIWQTVPQNYRRTPHVYIAGDFLIICTLSPSLLLFTPQQQALASSLASCTTHWRSDYRPALLTSLSGLMMLFEAGQPVVDIGPHLTDYLSAG